MLDYAQTNILRLSITWTGNKSLNEGILIPQTTIVTVNEYVHEVLTAAFFKPFEKNEEFFYFTHSEDVSQNKVYQACSTIFNDPEAFATEAAELTKRLYEFSSSPKITSGELFIALFDAVILQDEAVPAIGIFKIVNKDSFLRVERSAERFALGVGEGVGVGKLALAALVFGVDETDGFRVMATDNITKKDEASMWLSQFLEIKPIEDNYYNTRHYMNLAGEFITQEAPNKFGLDKTDTIDLVNKAAFYFKENEAFEVEDFTKAVFGEQHDRQEAFKTHLQDYKEQSDAPLADSFDISKQAVRKTGRVFKNVIKLDDNFQIYVKGRRDWIERGFDEEKGKPFYKIYFDREE